MTRRPVPDHEKRQNVGLRLHPVTIERLDEIASFFKKLRELNPLLPFRYPESRTEVIEWMLREGTLDVLRRVQVWSRVGTPEMHQGDMDYLESSHFWNMLLTEVRHFHEAIPESWLGPNAPYPPSDGALVVSKASPKALEASASPSLKAPKPSRRKRAKQVD